MVAHNSPDGLPPGWKVNCKVLDSGRKLKYYTDLRSGKKLYSMNEVFRYMKCMSGRRFEIQQLHSCNGQRKPSIVARNLPEELPAGYTVNCKVLNSGRKLKYYTDLKTGKKFYSMNEVARYIKSNSGKSFTTRTSSGKRSNGSLKKDMHGIKKTNPDSGCLPDGWLIELRQYEAGPKTGREYKVYVDKSTGHKCYSRREVFRYLKKQNDNGHMVREIKKATTTRSRSHEDKNDSKSKMEEHIDVAGCGKTTPNYNKLSRSAQNVSSRALQNTSPDKALKLAAERKKYADKGTYDIRSFIMSDGQVNGVQTRGSKRRQQSDLEIESASTTDVLKDDNISSGIFKMHTTNKTRGSMPCRFSKRLAGLNAEVATNVSSVDWAQAPPVIRSDRDQKALSLPMIEKMTVGGKGYQPLSVTEIDRILKEESIVSTTKNSYDSSDNRKNIREGRLCRRFSKRLAGFEPEVAAIPDSSDKLVQDVEKKLCTYQGESISGSALSAVVHKSCKQHSCHTEKPDLSRCLLNKSSSENGLDSHQSLGLGGNAGNAKHKTRPKMRSHETKGVAGAELEAVSNSVGKHKSRLTPTTSHDVDLATTETCKDQETQQQTPIWHSWSDPCLEFAFKTLTGEISIEDDLQIQSYFQKIRKPAEKDASAINANLGSPKCNPPMDAPQKSFSREKPPADMNSGSIVGYNWINFQQSNGGLM